MKLSQLGEFGLIRRLATFLHDQPAQPGEGVVGIGDDCAVIPIDRRESLLVTTDLLVEDVHFQLARISPQDLGYKSLAVNLSDIAAMGGSPLGAFLSIGLPSSTDVAWVDGLFAGLAQLAAATRCPLLGGDTTRSPQRVVINLAVTGRMETVHVKYRHLAAAGDRLAVTGCLGDSAAGMRILLGDIPCRGDDDMIRLVQRHQRPRPHLDEGRWLARQPGVHAMLDVSDGIASDIVRIMERSRLGARVELDRLPLSASLKRVAAKQHWNASELAAWGGEDYCLLVAVAEDAVAELAVAYRTRFGRALHTIGSLTADETTITWLQDGRPVRLANGGFSHFHERQDQTPANTAHGS